MFSFLKNKLKGVLSKFSKKVESAEKEEVKVDETVQEKQIKEHEPTEDLGVEKEIKIKREVKIEKAEPSKKEREPELEEKTWPKTSEPQAKKGFFAKLKEGITTKKISEKQFNELFWELELVLLENNVAVEVVEKIKNDLREELVEKPIPRMQVEESVKSALKQSVLGLFGVESDSFLNMVKSKSPFVICFVGVNGSGKTTTIAKVARLLQDNGLSVVIAAADTFRAAAIDQLQMHADKLGVKLVRHDYGADAAAVAFDAVKHAQSKGKDVVLIDTAGRLHSNINLMDEMKKIVRVAKPDLKIFVGESITGNDCVEQANRFDEAIGVDGIILAKADVDEKGGAALSISYVTKKPILFLGTGQNYEDLIDFNREKLVASLGL